MFHLPILRAFCAPQLSRFLWHAQRARCISHVHVTDQFGERRISELRFDESQSVVHFAMKRAQIGVVRGQSQRANLNALDGVNRVDDLQNRDLMGRACQFYSGLPSERCTRCHSETRGGAGGGSNTAFSLMRSGSHFSRKPRTIWRATTGQSASSIPR